MPDILIVPKRSTTENPQIFFSGSVQSSASIRMEVLPEGQVSFLGKSGSLFGVTDSLVGSLMSVSDISGLPILEVFSDDKVVMGKFNQNTLVVTGSTVGIGKANPNSATRLDVSGSVFVTGSVSTTGSLSVGGTVSIFGGSPLRLYNLANSEFASISLNASNRLLINYPIDLTGNLIITGSITGSGGIGLLAGGSNTNVTLTPAGSGYVHVVQSASTVATPNYGLTVAITGTSNLVSLGNNTDYAWLQSFNSRPLSINPLGNSVGIGKTNPSITLDVNGGVYITGSLNISSSTSIDPVAQVPNQLVPEVAFCRGIGSASGPLSVLAFGSSARLGLLRGVHDGSGTVQWRFGNYSGTTFVEGVRFASSTSGLSVGGVEIYHSTPSTSPTNGALIVSGGLGVGGATNIGGNVIITGSLNVTGSLSSDGINGNALFGGVKRLVVGYDNTTDVAAIASIQTGVMWKPLALQPISGQVLIGKTNANATFDVNGNSIITGSFTVLSNTGVIIARASNPDQALTLTGGDGGGISSVSARYQLNLNSNDVSYPMTFQIAGSEKMRITSAGNVAIGKTTTNGILDVNGNVVVTGSLRITGSMVIEQDISASSANFRIQNVRSPTPGNIIFAAGSSPAQDRMIITGLDGRVGINTNNPQAQLEVKGNTIISSSVFSLNSEANTYGKYIYINPSIDPSGTNMYLGTLASQSDFRVAIGKRGGADGIANAKLDVNGNTIITGSLTVTNGIQIQGVGSDLIHPFLLMGA